MISDISHLMQMPNYHLGIRKYNLDDILTTFIDVYDNDYLSIINIYFYETFSTLTQNI
jgi:hypothetical protein